MQRVGKTFHSPHHHHMFDVFGSIEHVGHSSVSGTVNGDDWD